MERGYGLSAGHRPFGRAHPLTEGTEPRPLVPLGEYEVPTLPTDQTLRRAWREVLHALRPDPDEGPLVDRGKLDRSTRERLDGIAAGPATAPAEADLAADLGPWVADNGAMPRLQVVVVPPGAPRDPLAHWAEDTGLTLLPVPPRRMLTDMPGPPAPDLSGDGVLVIPRLEEWMLRHENGLDSLRELLAALAATRRRAVVGCDSWAWAYLTKAVDAGLALPCPRTFAPHDADRLKAWLGRLSGAVQEEGSIFRLASDGTDVFGADGEGDAHFRRLAATSLGIPWVAWEIWRNSLRALHPEEDEEVAEEAKVEAARDDDRTVWIVDPSPPSLPKGHEQEAMMVLHAVLVHGTLERGVLDRVLPAGRAGAVLEALVSAEFLLRDGDLLSAAPAAYPEARRALVNAGFPQDGL